VAYRLRINSLPFYLFGERPESVPLFGAPEGWELESDQQAAGMKTLSDLAAVLTSGDGVRVLTRANHVREIEEAIPGPLAVAGTYGRGRHAIVLAGRR
jgi:hypothetical protein